MSYSFPDSFGDFTNGSTFEVDDVYYQGWPWPASGHGDEAHFYRTPANIEAVPFRNQLEPQSNLPLHEGSTSTLEVDAVYYQGLPASGHGDEAHFYQTSANIEALQNRNQLEPQFNLLLHKTQPRGTGEPVITKGLRGLDGHTSTHPEVRICAECNKEFGRVQELKRHQKDRHEPPRECPLCGDFAWKRPYRIKDHLVTDHKNELTPEMLAQIDTLHGQKVVAFVDSFVADPRLHNVTSFLRQ